MLLYVLRGKRQSFKKPPITTRYIHLSRDLNNRQYFPHMLVFWCDRFVSQAVEVGVRWQRATGNCHLSSSERKTMRLRARAMAQCRLQIVLLVFLTTTPFPVRNVTATVELSRGSEYIYGYRSFTHMKDVALVKVSAEVGCVFVVASLSSCTKHSV